VDAKGIGKTKEKKMKGLANKNAVDFWAAAFYPYKLSSGNDIFDKPEPKKQKSSE
jgi:hypothetical protein